MAETEPRGGVARRLLRSGQNQPRARQAAVQAMAAPAAREAFAKQHFNIVPSKSVDDAKTWLADEMKNWKTITDAVKIEVTE